MSTPTCTKCGLRNAPESSECVRCGAPIAAKASRSPAATVAVVVCTVLGAGLLVVLVVAAIAIPALMKARAAANEAAAVSRLRMISTAEITYQATNDRFGRMRELAAAGLVSADVRDGATLDSYRFRESPPTETTFDVAAEPDGRTAGSRAFNITEDAVVRYADGPTAPRGASGSPL